MWQVNQMSSRQIIHISNLAAGGNGIIDKVKIIEQDGVEYYAVKKKTALENMDREINNLTFAFCYI